MTDPTKESFDRITAKMADLVEELQETYPHIKTEISTAWDNFIIPIDEALSK